MGDVIIAFANPYILTYSTSDESDLVCEKKLSTIDCSQSPMGFRFGIKIYTSNDNLTNQITVKGNYSTCGQYTLSSTASYYDQQTLITTTQTASTSIDVLCPTTTSTTTTKTTT